MIEVATASINNFASGKADFVQPSDQLITLTYGQLQDLIQEAIERATAPLEARIDRLEDVTKERGAGSGEGREDAPDSQEGHDLNLQVVQHLQVENMALKRELEAFQEHVAQERAFDRQRIARLEQRPAPTIQAGTKTAARIERIKTILKSSPRTFGELERILKISPREMLRITKQLDMRCFEISRRPGDARQKVLRLRSQL